MKKLTIIGGGPAGYAAALYASNFELEITLIESDTLGGTCLNRGCIPAKYWLHVAELNHEIENSKDFGIEITGKNIDWKTNGRQDIMKIEIMTTKSISRFRLIIVVTGLKDIPPNQCH